MLLPPNAFATHRLQSAVPVSLPGGDVVRSRQAVFCLCVAVLLHVLLLKLWSTPVLLARGEEQTMLLVDVSLGEAVAEASATASRAISSSAVSQDVSQDTSHKNTAPPVVEQQAADRSRVAPRDVRHEPRQQASRQQSSRQQASSKPQSVSHAASSDNAPSGEAAPSATPHVMSMPAASMPVASASREPVLVETPQFVSPPQYPAYPAVAQRRGQQGTVWLEIWLSETGKQLRLSIVRSSGFAVLDEAAKTAASSWQFMPHRLNGMVVASRVQVPVEFVIH